MQPEQQKLEQQRNFLQYNGKQFLGAWINRKTRISMKVRLSEYPATLIHQVQGLVQQIEQQLIKEEDNPNAHERQKCLEFILGIKYHMKNDLLIKQTQDTLKAINENIEFLIRIFTCVTWKDIFLQIMSFIGTPIGLLLTYVTFQISVAANTSLQPLASKFSPGCAIIILLYLLGKALEKWGSTIATSINEAIERLFRKPDQQPQRQSSVRGLSQQAEQN